MGKHLWLGGGLAFLGVLAYAGWQHLRDVRAEANEQRASAALGTRGETADEHALASPLPKPPQPPASAELQLSTASAASNDSNHGQPSDTDVRWQVAVGIPQQVREELETSDAPESQQMLQRNRRLLESGVNDTWGPQMQARLNDFFLSRPEGESIQITVACRESQCQIQAVNPEQSPSSSAESQALFNELRRHFWFKDQLSMAQSHVTTVDGRRYHLQYFDRKQ